MRWLDVLSVLRLASVRGIGPNVYVLLMVASVKVGRWVVRKNQAACSANFWFGHLVSTTVPQYSKSVS